MNHKILIALLLVFGSAFAAHSYSPVVICSGTSCGPAYSTVTYYETLGSMVCFKALDSGYKICVTDNSVFIMED